MNILVCIKQVPDTNDVKIDSKTNNLVREGVPSIINPFDEAGVEIALRLREIHGGLVTVISMGPLQAKEALKHCLDMGADDAYLLSDRILGGADTLATGYILSELASGFQYDLIICGSEAIDGCTGQVGPIMASNLGIPQFTYVSDLKMVDGKVKVTRSVGKYLEYCEADGKVLVCVLKDIAVPRRPQSCDKEPVVMTAADLPSLDLTKVGIDGSPTRVVTIQMSDSRQKSYVSIDDSLTAAERIQMIINGGIEKKEKIELKRGSSAFLADKILNNQIVAKYV